MPLLAATIAGMAARARCQSHPVRHRRHHRRRTGGCRMANVSAIWKLDFFGIRSSIPLIGLYAIYTTNSYQIGADKNLMIHHSQNMTSCSSNLHCSFTTSDMPRPWGHRLDLGRPDGCVNVRGYGRTWLKLSKCWNLEVAGLARTPKRFY